MRLPDAMELAKANGHDLPETPEQAGPFGSVTRWSCRVCMRGVLVADTGNVWGTAITDRCAEAA